MPSRLASIVLVVCLISIGMAAAQAEPLTVVATTTLIADVARNVGGDLVQVTSLIPPNADVHAFEPTPQDVLTVAKADVVLVNGAGLEAFLGLLVENAAGVEPVVVSTGIPMLAFGEHDYDHEAGEAEAAHDPDDETIGLLGEAGVCDLPHEHETEADHTDEHEHGNCDPHVWTNPQNVKIWAGKIAEAFAAADPAHAEDYRANAEAYSAQLDALDAEIRDILSAIPEGRRVLVTNHEFFGYFAAAYDFEIVGVVIAGGATLNDPNPQVLAALIDTVTEANVPAIFAEVSSSPGLAETVAQETGIPVINDIYSDSLSTADGPASTYLDFMRHNAQVIADALSR